MRTVYELGPFRLNPEAGVLTHDGVATALGARGVAVLAALISRAGEYVEKSAILDAAWPGLVIEAFVGRERELAEIKQKLATARLMTLTGIGGLQDSARATGGRRNAGCVSRWRLVRRPGTARRSGSRAERTGRLNRRRGIRCFGTRGRHPEPETSHYGPLSGTGLRLEEYLPSLSDVCERQYKSRKCDDAHRRLHPTTDQIKKTMPEGLPTGV